MNARRQLGKALGILLKAQAVEIIMHQDISAWGAPGECHKDVRRGEARRFREARRHAQAVGGMSERVMWRKARKITGSDKWQEKALSRVLERYSPF